MSENFFAMMSRMKYINRWGLMRNTIKENIAEHSLETGMIAHALAVINNIYFEGNINPDNPAEWNEEDEALLKEIEIKFKDKNTSVICKDLKGITTGNVLRSCRGCVEDAAEILEEVLCQ